MSVDGNKWVLINASPDLREQINSHPQLWPEAHVARGTRISSIVLTDSQIDHTTGLLTLREGLPLPVYCTDVVNEDLTTSFPLFTVLKHWHGGLQQRAISTDFNDTFVPEGADGLAFQPVVLESNAPPIRLTAITLCRAIILALKLPTPRQATYCFMHQDACKPMTR